MYEIISLVKRNVKIYLRDKLAVFFSFLSTIILMMIYILFLGDIGSESLTGILDKNEISFLVYGQMMAGVIVLNTLTIPLGNLGTVVTDFEQGKVDAFMVTPVKRYKIILGYYLSSLLITLVFSIVFWLLAATVLGFVTKIFYPIGTILLIVPVIMLFVFISTSIMILITTFIKSINAFGAVSGIFGSLIGFVSGIYIPLSSSSPVFLNYISSLIPFTHMGIFAKQILMAPGFELIKSKGGSEELISGLKDGFGYNEIGVLGIDLNLTIILILSIVLSMLLLLYATNRLNNRIKG